VRESLLDCIKQGIEEINITREQKIPIEELDSIRIYGEGGVFDSMQLVNFLMVVEEKMSDQMGLAMTIVSEKAISRKVSPFSTVSALLEYLVEEAASITV
jgi:hypothetical protein